MNIHLRQYCGVADSFVQVMLPALLWFSLNPAAWKERPLLAVLHVCVFLLGSLITVGGMYANIVNIRARKSCVIRVSVEGLKLLRIRCWNGRPPFQLCRQLGVYCRRAIGCLVFRRLREYRCAIIDLRRNKHVASMSHHRKPVKATIPTNRCMSCNSESWSYG